MNNKREYIYLGLLWSTLGILALLGLFLSVPAHLRVTVGFIMLVCWSGGIVSVIGWQRLYRDYKESKRAAD